MSKIEIYPEGTNISKYKKKFIGEGDDFSCYKIGNQVYKEIKSDSKYNYSKNKTCLELQLTIENNSFAFPVKVIYYKTSNNKYKFQGIITPFVEGINLDKIPDSEQLQNIIKAFQTYEKNLSEITSKKIEIRDSFTENLIYTPSKEIVCIDTNSFKINNDVTSENQYEDINDDLKSAFFSNLVTINTYPFRIAGKDISIYFKNAHKGKLSPSQYLTLIKKYIEHQTKQKISTVGEMRTLSQKIYQKK